MVQNPDDYQAMAALGIAPERIALIPGSGVDTERLRALPEPAGPITMAYVGRLLDDKGLRALIAAHALLEERGEAVRLLIAGETDPANPASIRRRRSRPGAHSPRSNCSATSPTSPASGRKRISRCCRRGAKGCL